ncbi:MAG: hypothetical protein A2014_09455 [Spirochaetes bacterium GWF1_49_6]|nr:MAG: hypothetical protein A2014_09455 [Spirochaetes bacterium GWF1_49_6]
MDWILFAQSDVFKWVILPLMIIAARLCDVSLGTMRVIFIGKGYRFLAPLIGFFEVMIWLLAISQIINNLTNIFYMITYATGFALGNFLGMSIEKRISLGTVIVRVITHVDSVELVEFLRTSDYGTTVIDGEGSTGPVKLIFTVMERKQIPEYIEIVKRFNPGAFYTIEDVRYVEGGIIDTGREKRRRLQSKRK